MVECARCGLVYSNPYFDDDILHSLYREASYIDEPQLANMGADYLRQFMQAATNLNRSARILEIGCANGFFLEKLREAGFTDVYGVEPGKDAAQKAPATIRNRITNDFFGRDCFPPASFDAACCFQIFDHLPDPNGFLRDVHVVLKPGGLLVAINHNIRAVITGILGERSPMYDIEHICLFDKKTIRRIFEANGFEVVNVKSLSNSYTFAYAVKMLPLPAWLKIRFLSALGAISIAGTSVRIPAGNMLTVGRKKG